MAAKKLNLVIRQGETFIRVIRWETLPFVYKAVTAITNAAPVRITSTGHGLASGWRVAVISAGGMDEINAVYDPPRDTDYRQVTVIDANTVELNSVNSTDFGTYTTGGYLKYYTPVSLAGFSARMKIKNKIGGTLLETLTSGAPDNQITLDDTNHTITLTIAATDTDSLSFPIGYYDLELVGPTGTVTTLYYGTVTVTKEVTT